MKKTIAFLILFQSFVATLFAQQTPIKGVYFQCMTNLVMHWKAPKHPWPTNLWTYQVVPTRYSPETISNLMNFFSFTEKDKHDYGEDGIFFGPWDSYPRLRIASIGGEVEFRSVYNVFPLNYYELISTNKAISITTNVLAKIGISLSELTRDKKGKPILRIVDNEHLQYEGGHPVTNIVQVGNEVREGVGMEGGRWATNATSRVVKFDRDIGGLEIWIGCGEDGSVVFGTNNAVISMTIHWKNLERYKCYPAPTSGKVMQWIREGKATFQRERYVPTSLVPIDWCSAKSLTITKAKALYWSENFRLKDGPLLPSYVTPFVQLSATIDTGKEKFDAEIWCPLFEEAKP